ncbi:MAG: CHAD domain-containing protein [Armatimonadota bacterium]
MSKGAWSYPPDARCDEAARWVLEAGFRIMMDNLPGTLEGLRRDTPSPEGVLALHDMRVGSRRLRAALDVFLGVLPAGARGRIRRTVRDVTRGLGLVRDFDVQIEAIRNLAADLPENESYGLGRVIARLNKRREKVRHDLIATLEHLDQGRFREDFAAVLVMLPVADAPGEGA